MAKFDNPLNNLKIASPCSQDWNEMIGDDRTRYCGACKLNVHNLSGMTRDEAENLLTNSSGRLCVRFYQRADGTVLTQDCPVGWAKIKQRANVFATAAFSLLVSLFGSFAFVSLFPKPKEFAKKLPVIFATPTPEALTGAIAMPSPKPKQSPTPKQTPRVVEMKGEISEEERPALVGKMVSKEYTN